MELLSKFLEQIAFNRRPKKEEHMLIVMDKFNHEEHLFQPLQTKPTQFKLAIIFLFGYNGFFDVTNLKNKFYFIESIQDDDFTQMSISPGAYEKERLKNEFERIIIEEGYFIEAVYPSTVQPSILPLGSTLETK